jgi:hypothetical protein
MNSFWLLPDYSQSGTVLCALNGVTSPLHETLPLAAIPTELILGIPEELLTRYDDRDFVFTQLRELFCVFDSRRIGCVRKDGHAHQFAVPSAWRNPHGSSRYRRCAAGRSRVSNAPTSESARSSDATARKDARYARCGRRIPAPRFLRERDYVEIGTSATMDAGHREKKILKWRMLLLVTGLLLLVGVVCLVNT